MKSLIALFVGFLIIGCASQSPEKENSPDYTALEQEYCRQKIQFIEATLNHQPMTKPTLISSSEATKIQAMDPAILKRDMDVTKRRLEDLTQAE